MTEKKKDIINQVADTFCTVEKIIATLLFFLMLILMLVQVIFRYVLHQPLAWSEEALRFTFIAASFVGAIVATRERKHVEINFLFAFVSKIAKTKKMQTKILSGCDIVATAICAGFCAFLFQMMWTYTMDLKSQSQISVAMEMPMWWVGAVVSISLLLCGFHFILNLLNAVKNIVDVRKGATEQ